MTRKYLVLHTHPDNLVISPRDVTFLEDLPDVISVKECSLFSVQYDFFDFELETCRINGDTLTLILWGMSDRYDEAKRRGVEVVEAKNGSDCHAYAQGLIPRTVMMEGEDGHSFPVMKWVKRDD